MTNTAETVELESPKIQRLLYVNRRYQELGTLAGVGRELGLSRERVRQLIQSGVNLSLFEYRKRKELPVINLSRESFLEDFQNLLQLRLVAKKNGISLRQLNQLLKAYGISHQELETAKFQGHQIKTILEYYTLVNQKGHHLSTTDLQRIPGGRYLSFKITRLWGSIQKFRKDLRIAFHPRKGSSRLFVSEEQQ
jgi:ribosomal protein S14